ncbi:DUF1592 domain-containing protein [Fimbriiglobus ruber]|nr:DUF1592 domain-containing protein [Fimbriiglobus ruber]
MSVVLSARALPASVGRLLAVMVLLGPPPVRAADPYQDKVLPFLGTYCVQCHTKQKASGDLDLTRFTSVEKVADDFRQWEHVVTFLKKEEMPPAKAKQPSVAACAEVIAVLEKLLGGEARKLAGDPGVVPPRRLTNAEYDYTIRDLTGADIHPARAFPIDPAAGEGFNNTGEALTMSPSLFKKYYAAGEQVADHALLTTGGLKFAPHPVVTFADRQKYYEQAIIRFYETHAVDYEAYFTAFWLYQHRPAAKAAATVEAWTTDRGLSPKYARALWDTLTGATKDEFVIGWLRQRWAALPAPKNPADPSAGEVKAAVQALAADVRKLSRELCPIETPAVVASAGNGPIDHIARRRKTADTRDTFDATAVVAPEFRVEFKNVADKPTLRLLIQVTDVGQAADGFVAVNGMFTTSERTPDNVKRWSLRNILATHAPDELAKLAFGTHPLGTMIDPDAFVIKAPATLEIDVPTKVFPFRSKGSVTFSANCKLDGSTAGAVIVGVRERKPKGDDQQSPARPLVDTKRTAPFAVSAATFCKLFPSRFYYVDSTRGLSAGFHLIEGFFRDDVPLCRSVLSDTEKRELDGFWAELYFATGIWEKMLRGFVFFERSERNFLKHTDFDSFKEEDPELVKDETLARFKEVYLKRSGVKLTGDALSKHPISVFFEDVRAGLKWQAATLMQAEPNYLRDLLAFAERAYRRPLTGAERQKVETFYSAVCHDKDHGTEAAVRASVVRVLVSPHFCMRFDAPPAGESAAPLPDLALAARLSYFIWSGPPDDELLALAKAGKLHDERVLREQIRRMVKDEKVNRFALEFFGQWLGYRDFLAQESVDRRVFPAFDDALKTAMFEEPTRVIANLIRTDKPITDILNGDVTFVNKSLARHYGLPFRGTADEWEPVTGLRVAGRGGVLGMAVFLTKNSQPQRTSPVKRGFWVVHKVLGEHIPPPPPDVAVLPSKETDTNGKTIRQLMKLHVADAKCASCHQRFDPIGLAMEGFDPIGRSRAKDLAGRPVDNLVSLPSGKETRGVPEFGDYLATNRKAEFTTTLAHKFLGYALGRSLQLSDQPLLEQMQAALAADGAKLSAVFELVVLSPQFRTQRCKDFTPTKFRTDPSPGGEK